MLCAHRSGTDHRHVTLTAAYKHKAPGAVHAGLECTDWELCTQAGTSPQYPSRGSKQTLFDCRITRIRFRISVPSRSEQL
eukprot:3038458-Prymnesium_polylepis.1